MPQTVETIGFPFLGYFSRGPRHEAPPGYFTGGEVGSLDWAFSPRHGKWKRRAGSAISGDTISSGHEAVGLLPAKWSSIVPEMYAPSSPSLADGAPTYAATFTSESGVWGQVYYRDTNDSTNHTVGDRHASDYPLAGASTPNRFRMVPLWCENALRFSRCFNEKQRRMIVPGTRRSIAVGNWRYYPNQQGTPAAINNEMNDTSTTAYAQKVWPWGNIPPLYVPDISLPAATTNGYETWLGDDRFILAVAFRDEHGALSRPTLVRSPATVALQAFGAKTNMNMTGWVDVLDSTSAVTKFKYIQYNNIPIGPPGTTGRVLMRTQKVLASTFQIPSMATLGVIDEITNNTTTTYKDYNGSSTAIVVDATNIRFADHKWPRRGRYAFTFYGHVALCGKLRANPGALIVAPRQINGTYYVYDDAGAAAAPNVPWVAVTDNQIPATRKVTIQCGWDANAPSSGTAALSSSVTLTDVCDVLNASVNADTTTTYGDWKATTVPGIDANATVNNLEVTKVYANFTTVNNNATITVAVGGDGAAGSVANVVAGMWVTGAGIPTKTYIGTVGATTCTLVNAAGAAVLATASATVPLKIGWDLGDSVPGEFRAFSNAYPVVLYFNKAYQDALPTEDRAVDFTGADPGHAKYAANSFYFKNRRSVPAGAGRAMGGGEVDDGALVFYSNGMARIVNTRGGNTNADDDWIIKYIYGRRGTISPEIVHGNGWLARWTAQGIEASDSTRTVLLSEAVYDSTEKVGDFAYEIQKMKSAATSDGNDFQGHMLISDGKLYVSFRSSSSVTYPDRYMVYDFSPSQGAFGVDEVLKRDGTPYGWSCPHQVRVGAMCEIQKSDGTHLYGAIEANAGSTGDGRIDEFETGATDNGTAVTPIGYFSPLLAEDQAEYALKGLRPRYKSNGAGMRLGVSRDKTRSGGNADYLSLPTSSTDDFKIQRLPVLSNMTTNKEVLEFWLSDDGSGSGKEFAGMTATYETVQSTQRR